MRSGPSAIRNATQRGFVRRSSTRRSSTRSSVSRSPSPSPNTARRMISSVTACIRGRTRIGVPLGHRAISALAMSAISVAVALHPRPVERREHQLALRHVLGAVEQQQRVLAEDREQDPVRLAGVEQVGIAGEHRLDVVGVRDHHPRALVGDAQPERVAVALAALRHHPLGAAKPDRGLERPRHARARREGGRCHRGVTFAPSAYRRRAMGIRGSSCPPKNT